MSDLILVLDDELSYATMVSDLLQENGYQTDVCTQPREAIERLHQKSYGLIVSDYKMPEVDGAELLLEIRKVLPHVPVIMISGLMGKPDLLKVANIGVTLVLEKPFNVPAFLSAIGRFVNPSENPEVALLVAEPSASGSGIEPSYPRPPSHLPDASPAMQSFLNELWSRVRTFTHTVVIAPPGGELEAVASECAAWLDGDPEDLERLSLPALGRPESRAGLRSRAESGEACPLVVIGVPDYAEVEVSMLEDFARWTREESAGCARLRFLHFLPDVIEARQFNPPGDLVEVMSNPLVLPTLRDRLVDLGAWVRRLLENDAADPARARALSAEAVELLLAHDWPGNHHELAATVRRAAALARRGEITHAAVRKAMVMRHGSAPDEAASTDLSGFLHAEQVRYLRRHLPKNNWFDALGRLVGGRIERLRADRELEEQPLLFEELAETAPTS